MAKIFNLKQPGLRPAAADLETALADIAASDIDQLRELWRQERGSPPPAALSRDLLARALTYSRQEQALGGVDPHVRKFLKKLSSQKTAPPVRHVKIGSIIVREHQGQLHEVLVVPDGFCWQGQTYASLSTIAKKITGTSWNGPRFFGLRGASDVKAAAEVDADKASSALAQRPVPTSIKLKMPVRRAGGAA